MRRRVKRNDAGCSSRLASVRCVVPLWGATLRRSSLAMLAAMRRASSRVSRLADACRCAGRPLNHYGGRSMLTNRASRPPLLLPSCRLLSNSTGKIVQYSVRLYDYIFFLRFFRKPNWDVKRVWVGPNAECHAVCLAILTHFHRLPLDKNAFDLNGHVCVSVFPPPNPSFRIVSKIFPFFRLTR